MAVDQDRQRLASGGAPPRLRPVRLWPAGLGFDLTDDHVVVVAHGLQAHFQLLEQPSGEREVGALGRKTSDGGSKVVRAQGQQQDDWDRDAKYPE